MTSPADSKLTGAAPVRPRRPRAGERNRGAVDALQTKIAVNIQNLDAQQFARQLHENIAELPDAAACDCAFLALFSADGNSVDSVISSGAVFTACNPDALAKESLYD
jgi:hypothetical protein